MVPGVAWAQLETMSSLRAATPPPGMGGVRVGEALYLRLGVLAEAGYDTNVFYNDLEKREATTLQVTPRAELTNMNRDGLQPVMQFSLSASLLYREYLAEDATVETQRAFNPTVSGSIGYAATSAFTVSLVDTFSRLEDPPYAPGGAIITRDYNLAVLDMRITPGGGRLQNNVRYTNTLDIFENESASFANRMAHDLAIGLAYKLLPKTALFIEGGIGYVQLLNEEQAVAQGKANSIPYRGVLGLRGLVTPRISVNILAGYQDSQYDRDVANPDGLSNLLVGASLGYQIATLTSLVVGYEHTFRDSPIIGNFYDVDAAAISLNQQLAAFVLRGFYLYEFRRYQGLQQMSPVSRRDHLQRAGVQADYFLQRWFFAGLGFSAAVNRSSFGQLAVAQTPADYTKFTFLGRLGITY